MSHRTVTLEEARRQARELGLTQAESHSDTGSAPPHLTPPTMDRYQILAAQFRERTQITDPDAQFKALVEEVGELAEALNRGDDTAISDELADVLVTTFVLADIEGLDIQEAYQTKMAHNLKKSGQKHGGKVLDDA